MRSACVWLGGLGEVEDGKVHRILQIEEGDCLVEAASVTPATDRWPARTNDDWRTEEDDSACARAYMMAFLEARKALAATVSSGMGLTRP